MLQHLRARLLYLLLVVSCLVLLTVIFTTSWNSRRRPLSPPQHRDNVALHANVIQNPSPDTRVSDKRNVSGASDVTPELFFVEFASSNNYNIYFVHRESSALASEIWPSAGSNNTSYGRSDSQMRFIEELATHSKSARKVKSIVLVGNFYFKVDDNQGRNFFSSCPIKECTLTQGSNRVKYSDFDVVMIASLQKRELEQRLLPKPPQQIWISHHRESAARNEIDTLALGPYVNWSSSYRPDSHLLAPYGRFRKLTPPEIVAQSSSTTSINYAAGRIRKVAWFVSNCRDKNGRLLFVRNFRMFIKVDVYGRCGKLKCGGRDDNQASCFAMLKKNYKFYLAFENSNCRHYMTEKVFRNAYSNDVIPIVMGAHPDDYARVLPPHSYIHVDSFNTPRDLADYLHLLDRNDTLYNEYFRWKSEWTAVALPIPWCQLCGLLHVADAQNYTHWYPDYARYWDSNACSSKLKREGRRTKWLSW